MRPDAIVVRHPSSGAPHFLARHVDCPIINAGDGATSTRRRRCSTCSPSASTSGSIAGLTVAIVGDILHSRVARSNVHALRTLGARGAPGRPADAAAAASSPRSGASCTTTCADGVRDADVVMMLRIQRERQGGNYFPSLDEYSRYFCLTEDAVAAGAAAT